MQVDKVLEHVRSKQLHHHHPQAGSGNNILPQNSTTASDLPLLVDKLLGNSGCYNTTPSHSPVLQQRHMGHHLKHSHHSGNQAVPPTPSPDSAIHSAYSYSSPAQSPVTSRHGSSHGTFSRIQHIYKQSYRHFVVVFQCANKGIWN